jgi:hypothetical protein
MPGTPTAALRSDEESDQGKAASTSKAEGQAGETVAGALVTDDSARITDARTLAPLGWTLRASGERSTPGSGEPGPAATRRRELIEVERVVLSARQRGEPHVHEGHFPEMMETGETVQAAAQDRGAAPGFPVQSEPEIAQDRHGIAARRARPFPSSNGGERARASAESTEPTWIEVPDSRAAGAGLRPEAPSGLSELPPDPWPPLHGSSPVTGFGEDESKEMRPRPADSAEVESGGDFWPRLLGYTDIGGSTLTEEALREAKHVADLESDQRGRRWNG